MQQKKTRIKICGLTSEEEVRFVIEENVDYLGMVLFFPKSKRNISIERAKQLLAVCKEAKQKSVAVTVSPTPEQVIEIAQAGFDFIQIHGELSKETYEAITLPVIRAIQMKADEPVQGNEQVKDDEALHEFLKEIQETIDTEDKIAAYLFDAPAPGSGRTFDWNILAKLQKDDIGKGKMLFLAGGLNSANVAEAIKIVNPDVVDVSSGVEADTKTALKDRNKIKEFVRKVETDE